MTSSNKSEAGGRMLRSRVALIMTGREKQPFFSLATFLSGVSHLYAGTVRLRRGMYGRGLLASLELPCPVISVGNLAMGGTGKTPMVIHLARRVETLGYRCAILSRGYKGTAETTGAVVSDGKTILCDARCAGDEPFLMAAQLPAVPVLVGRNRYSMGMEAVKKYRPDVILLDDGYQHLRLKRDLNIVLLDAGHPFGNGYLFPRGTLREPVDGLRRADVVVLTRSEETAGGTRPRLVRLIRPKPLFASTHRSVIRGVLTAGAPPTARLAPCNEAAGGLTEASVFAFAGLGRNDSFFQSIPRRGAHLAGAMGFEDHYAYSQDDLNRIDRSADAARAGILVTSDKDFVRLPHEGRFSRDLVVMGVEMDFGRQAEAWREYIDGQIAGLIERGRQNDG